MRLPWRRRKDDRRWFVFSVSTMEASGPSGAGDRGGPDRNPRNDSGVAIARPRFGSLGEPLDPDYRKVALASKAEPCHCGKPVKYGFDGDPAHHRGMCKHCDSVRCDAFPGECEP